VMSRLRSKWPQLPDEVIEKRARKFSDKIFPIFLTREAAILKIVNRDLPDVYRDRIPKLLELERDERGYARRLSLSWLRNGGEPLSQVEFARQSADLLRVLHDHVGVMHLDLRLDNFVITPKGVGFVDFGSAVRADENLKESPLLNNLFEELMRTSEIQRMLFSMTRTGQVTSQAIKLGIAQGGQGGGLFLPGGADQFTAQQPGFEGPDPLRQGVGGGEAIVAADGADFASPGPRQPAIPLGRGYSGRN